MSLLHIRWAAIFRVLLLLLGASALTLVIPLGLAVVYGEGDLIRPFLVPMTAVLFPCLPVALLTRKRPIRFSASDGFLLLFLAWILICLFGAVPYYLSGRIPRWVDAVFESVSGFTTTGATVIADVEALPRSLLFWRAMTSWLGGMGIVVLTAALFPLLGIGGFRLLKGESSGYEKEKITPRITEAAKMLWFLYLILTALEVLLLCLGGMDWFDAAAHAFSTIATGGFSTRNNSIAAYHSPWIEGVCTVFMFLAGCNLVLLYRLFRGRYRDLLNNSELKAYGGIILVSAGIITLSLLPEAVSLTEAVRKAFFHTVSIVTTTGFAAADYKRWPPAAQGILFFLMFVGGCSGSIAGGIKVVRLLVLAKQTGNEMKRLLYPKGVFTIQLNKKTGRKDAVYGVAGFVFLYLFLVLITTLVVSTAGVDLFSSLNTALLTLGNIGRGLKGPPSGVFSDFPGYIKWALSLVMITGRLELWIAFVFFSRDYWRQ
ncbi:MAG: TrkH family potassium uptake protein [Spirochaetaceae bacterium]|jgi:trk system potassium uptake protein TrkH|nr:TrkH family potassium uptake protein [Spirochaetaceae bacterium]